MNNNIRKYKQQSYFMLAGLVLLLLAALQLGFLKTRKQIQHYHKLKKELALIENAPLRIQGIQTQLQAMELQLKKFKPSADIQQEILEQLSTYSKKKELQIRSLAAAHRYEEQGYLIETIPLELEGSFQALLGFVYHIEKREQLGAIISSSFERATNRKNGKAELHLNLWIQNIKPINP